MSRIRLVVLSLFAVFAVGAFAASSASAACSGGTKSVFCDHTGKEITNEKVLGTSGLSLLEGTTVGVAFKIHCTHDVFAGLLLALGASEGEIDFLGCLVEKPANCTVNNLIIASFTDQLSENVMPPTDLFKGLGATEEFAKFNIAGGSCSAASEITVLGLQTVEIGDPETALLSHTLVAKKSGSKLKVGGAIASFSSTATVRLESDLPWLTLLGT